MKEEREIEKTRQQQRTLMTATKFNPYRKEVNECRQHTIEKPLEDFDITS